jgi:hypothetical protein
MRLPPFRPIEIPLCAIICNTDKSAGENASMRKEFQAAAVALLLTVASTPVWATPRTDCQPQAIRDLQRLSPQGHAIYSAMTDKKQFLFFLTCDNVQLGLATAVHESVHMLTEQKDAYPLIAGGSIKRVREVSRFYPPREVARKFDQGDIYVQTYLRRGAASSADDVAYLLDELNAYSHDLNSATKLGTLHKGEGHVDHRAGLAALMSFLMGYADTAQAQKAATWQGFQRPEVKRLVQTLWTQAETVLADSLSIKGMGGEKYMSFLCSRANGGALGELLGRAPMSARACGATFAG